MISQLPQGSSARQPRGLIQINGARVESWVNWSIESNSLYRADTFSLIFALHGLPAHHDAAWFAEQTKADIEIFAGVPSDPDNFTASELTSLLQGRADEIEVDWVGGLIEITGRDRTADFIDNKTTEKYPNLTSSQIVEKLAAKHGLKPVVTATSTLVGKFYEIDKVRLQDDRTEWDLLTWLAREEGFVVYVKGTELHFEPAPDENQDPWVLKYTPATTGAPDLNATALKTTRTLTVAKDITVTVRSWNHKQKKAFVKKATRAKGSGPNVQQYSYTIAGLTPEQAQQRANQILAQLSKHEVKLSFDAPADTILTIRNTVQLQGTGTAFDQTYFPDTIHREMGQGFSMTVTAKNHSPESEPTP